MLILRQNRSYAGGEANKDLTELTLAVRVLLSANGFNVAKTQ
jgi:hypothetical protein